MKKVLFILLLSSALIIVILNFKTIILYKTGIMYCRTQKISSTGEFLSCQYNFMAKFDKNLAEKYLKIRDNCYKTSENQYEVSVCTDKKMTGLK